jgi:hypothetical protein
MRIMMNKRKVLINVESIQKNPLAGLDYIKNEDSHALLEIVTDMSDKYFRNILSFVVHSTGENRMLDHEFFQKVIFDYFEVFGKRKKKVRITLPICQIRNIIDKLRKINDPPIHEITCTVRHWIEETFYLKPISEFLYAYDIPKETIKSDMIEYERLEDALKRKQFENINLL